MWRSRHSRPNIHHIHQITPGRKHSGGVLGYSSQERCHFYFQGMIARRCAKCVQTRIRHSQQVYHIAMEQENNDREQKHQV